MSTSRPRRTFQPPPTPRRALSPGFLPGAFSSWSAGPAPAALYSTLASRRSLYSRLSMDRSRERAEPAPYLLGPGVGAGKQLPGSESRGGERAGAKGSEPRSEERRVRCGSRRLRREAVSGGGGGEDWREGGSETGSGFFKGVGGESGTGVMSLPAGPRPPLSLSPEGPPPLHTSLPLRKWPRHGQPPKSPPPLGGGGGHVGRGEPRGPGRERA